MDASTLREPGADVSALHRALVDELKDKKHITSPRVEAAFRAVPRHLFLPGVAPDRVYRDDAIPTKQRDGRAISSSSQPAIMAVMLEQLDLQPGQRVLEIGAGTGYNAALMAHIVGEAGGVVSVDIDDDIVAGAYGQLAAAGYERVRVVCGDGAFGHPDAAPYDRIILTVGAWDIAPAWREQLKPDGRLVLPLAVRGPQLSIAFVQDNDYLTSVSVKPCGFMPLRGALAAPDTLVRLGPDPGLSLQIDDPTLVDADAVYAALIGPHRDRPAAIRATPAEVFGSLALWLALREPGACGLIAHGAAAEPGLVPDLFRWSAGTSTTLGLLDGAGLAVLMRPPEEPVLVDCPDDAPPFALYVRSFGPHEAPARRLVERLTAWDAAGRPSPEGLRIMTYPHGTSYAPAGNEVVVEKRWTRLVLDWP